MSEFDDTSEPVETFEFFVAGFGYYRYTSSEKVFIAEAKAYSPLAGLSRSSVGIVSTNDPLDLTVTLPAAITLCRLIAMFDTPPKVTLSYRGYQRDTPNTVEQSYYGNFGGSTINGESCALKFPDMFNNATGTQVPKNKFQGTCNWQLGDANCKKVVADYEVTLTDVAYSSPATDGSGEIYYVKGIFLGPAYPILTLWPGSFIEATRAGSIERRSINKVYGFVNNASVYLNQAFSFPIDGLTSFRIPTVGCDNSANTCATIFNNFANFSGFPRMPTEKYNPYRIRLDRPRRN